MYPTSKSTGKPFAAVADSLHRKLVPGAMIKGMEDILTSSLNIYTAAQQISDLAKQFGYVGDMGKVLKILDKQHAFQASQSPLGALIAHFEYQVSREVTRLTPGSSVQGGDTQAYIDNDRTKPGQNVKVER
jgi:hypothetical protein